MTTRDTGPASHGTGKERRVNRRSFLETSLGIGAAAGVAGCLTGPDGSSENEIVLATYGGSYADAYKSIIPAFEEEFDAKVTVSPFGNPFDVLSKVEAGSTEVDVINYEDVSLYQAAKDGLLTPLRMENIPNADKMYDRFKPENNPADYGDQPFSVTNNFGADGLVYNHEELDDPSSWSDIFSEQTKGDVSLGGYINTVVANAGLRAGVDIGNLGQDASSKMDQIWSQVEREKEYVFKWWGSGSEMNQFLSSGRAIAGSQWYGRVQTVKEDEAPVTYTVPREGAKMWQGNLSILDGTEGEKRRAAEQFINYHLQDEPIIEFSKSIPYAPAVELSDPPQFIRDIPDRNHRDRLKLIDYEVALENSEQWRQKFQQIVQ